jgi:hypothetical protein
LAAAGVVALTTISIVVNFATGSSIDQWNNVAAITSIAVAAVALLAAVISSFLAGRTNESTDEVSAAQKELAFRLIRTFSDIEKKASLDYQQENPTESPHPISLRQVRVMMADSGAWDDQDQIAFDLATRTRNNIVHGDLGQVGLNDLRDANKNAENLLKKMQ